MGWTEELISRRPGWPDATAGSYIRHLQRAARVDRPLRTGLCHGAPPPAVARRAAAMRTAPPRTAGAPAPAASAVGRPCGMWPDGPDTHSGSTCPPPASIDAAATGATRTDEAAAGPAAW
ncbi:hypothetical protein DY245_19565 [Streptomyces inhibens]|uniref:Uncharacterized protein n=1 Tax=Streptomyces inhibens TaxID=2293571 RepID=A0A371Q344_STRIH|nr:hypothetical protein DY245_19565 [Streptomyces inhibens]